MVEKMPSSSTVTTVRVTTTIVRSRRTRSADLKLSKLTCMSLKDFASQLRLQNFTACSKAQLVRKLKVVFPGRAHGLATSVDNVCLHNALSDPNDGHKESQSIPSFALACCVKGRNCKRMRARLVSPSANSFS